jgi:hypothetical protein
MVSISSYDLALGSDVEKKKTALIEASGKYHVVACSAITLRYTEINVKLYFSKNKNSRHDEKNSGDSSYQALIHFSFSEFIFSSFRLFAKINSRIISPCYFP